MKSPDEINKLNIELEKLGLKQVGTQLAQGVYAGPQKTGRKLDKNPERKPR